MSFTTCKPLKIILILLACQVLYPISTVVQFHRHPNTHQGMRFYHLEIWRMKLHEMNCRYLQARLLQQKSLNRRSFLLFQHCSTIHQDIHNLWCSRELRHEKHEETEYNEIMRRKKNSYKAEFKSKVVIELLTGQNTLNELAAKYQIAPSTLSSWYKQFQEGAAEIFRRGPSEQEKILEEKEQEIAVLQQKVGQLIIERDWLKKKSDEVFGPGGSHQTRFLR